MRALQLLGLAEDGVHLVYEESETGERFAIPADERLRIAVNARPRGSTQRQPAYVRPGQQPAKRETPMEPTLRPREIQARIRGGATLEQVAAEAGCDAKRIERYAYPILVERGAVAERAKLVRPVVQGTPSRRTIEQLVRDTLGERGQAGSIEWDAYRTEAAAWVLKLTWNAGRSENTARWTFHPSAGGGSLTPLDSGATDIIDPAPRALRTVPEAVVEPEPTAPVNPLATQHSPAGETPAASEAQPEVQQELIPRPATAQPAPPSPAPARHTGNKVAAALAQHVVSSPTAAQLHARSDRSEPAERTDHVVARTGTDDPAARGRRAPMPSWEDVLLGVRTPGR